MYTPVVQQSIISLRLTLILSNDQSTKQIDVTNMFAQVEIMEEVYVEPSKIFDVTDKLDKILLLLKDFYVLK